MQKKINAFLIVCLAFFGLEVTKDRPEPIKAIPTIRIERPAVETVVPVEPIPLPPVKASWFDDKKVATGEKYNAKRITCAHRTLPFGTIVRVTNIANGKTVDCRINDRGPAKWTGKEIDLSKEAARQLGFIKHGTALVTLEIIK
jgi:hypothetical protein